MSIGDQEWIGRTVLYRENRICDTAVSQMWWYPAIPILQGSQPMSESYVRTSEDVYMDDSEGLGCQFKVHPLSGVTRLWRENVLHKISAMNFNIVHQGIQFQN